LLIQGQPIFWLSPPNPFSVLPFSNYTWILTGYQAQHDVSFCYSLLFSPSFPSSPSDDPTYLSRPNFSITSIIKSFLIPPSSFNCTKFNSLHTPPSLDLIPYFSAIYKLKNILASCIYAHLSFHILNSKEVGLCVIHFFISSSSHGRLNQCLKELSFLHDIIIQLP
jgi:hypothetical protein